MRMVTFYQQHHSDKNVLDHTKTYQILIQSIFVTWKEFIATKGLRGNSPFNILSHK